MFALALVLAVAGLWFGPALALAGKRSPRGGAALASMTQVLVPALILFRALPHLYEELGWLAVVLAGAGYLGLLAAERWAHGEAARAVVLPALVAHALVDGGALATAFAAEHGSFALTAALVAHKIPEGLVVSSTLSPAIGVRRTWQWLGVLGAATVGGALVGHEALARAPGTALHALVALGLGVMLRMVLHPAHAPPARATEATDTARAPSCPCSRASLPSPSRDNP